MHENRMDFIQASEQDKKLKYTVSANFNIHSATVLDNSTECKEIFTKQYEKYLNNVALYVAVNTTITQKKTPQDLVVKEYLPQVEETESPNFAN